MTQAVQPPSPPRLALTIKEAAESAGTSIWAIREAIDKGDLIKVHPTKTRPVILVEELHRWLRSLPTE
jgi:hypothetical protein